MNGELFGSAWFYYGVIVLNVTTAAYSLRQTYVSHRRFKVLERINVLTVTDMYHDFPWQWRYQLFDEASFRKQTYQLWKPIDSHWPHREAMLREREL